MKTLTIDRPGYVFRWGGGGFVAVWTAVRADEHVPDGMIGLPGSLNRSRAGRADIEHVADDWLSARPGGVVADVRRVQGWTEAEIAAEAAWQDKSAEVSATRHRLARAQEHVTDLAVELEALNYQLGTLAAGRPQEVRG